MYHHFYLRDGMVYVPTVGKMDRGFYRDVEPVFVVPASNAEALRQALADTVARGNPNVPMLRRRDWTLPVVLKHAGLKTWRAFEKGMSIWALEEEGGNYKIIAKRKKLNGATVDEPGGTVNCPPGSTANEVVDRLTEILKNATRK